MSAAAAPRVSIVLPVYNGERFLAEAIESCIGQSLRDWELIIVDDGSTDRSPQIIADYAARDSRIHSIRNTTNQKLPNTLNIGFAQARGEYRTWTSDDNAYYPEALATLAAELDADPKVGFVFSNFVFVNEIKNTERLYITNHKTPEKRMPYTNTVGACFMYRRTVAEQTHGYDDNFRIVEDYEYFLRLYFLTEFKYVAEVLYKYRWHDSSLSTAIADGYVEHHTGKAQIHHLQAMRTSRKVGRRTLSCALLRIAKRMRSCPHCRHLVKFYMKESFKTYPLIVFRGIEKRIWDY